MLPTIRELREDIAAKHMPDLFGSRDLAEMYGITRNEAGRRLSVWACRGVIDRVGPMQYRLAVPPPPKPAYWTAYDIGRLLDAKRKGTSNRELARMFGRSVPAIRRTLRGLSS